MRVKKSQLATLALAVSAAFSGAAFAGVDYTAVTPVANNYANELRGTSGATVFTNSVAPDSTINTPTLNFQFAIGFGASSGQNRYIRIELPAGATWTGAAPVLSTNAQTTGTTLVNGGQGSGFAVWQITATTTAGLSGTQAFIVSPSTITLASGFVGNVTLKVTTHETAVSATGANTAVLATPVNSLNYLAFANSVTPTVTNITANTLQASSNFQQFCTGTNCTTTQLTVPLMTVAVAVAGSNLKLAATASNDYVVAADLFGTASAFRVSPGTGSSFGASGATVFIAATTSCAGGPLTIAGNMETSLVGSSTAAAINTSVTFTVGTGAAASGTNNVLGTVCYTTPGNVSLPDLNTFNVTYLPTNAAAITTAQNGVTPTSTVFAGTAGTNNGWVREGVTLQAPWAAFAQTGVASRIFMTNTNNSAVACTARVGNDATGTAVASVTYTNGGTGYGFTIPAGGGTTPSIVEVPINATSNTTALAPIIASYTGNARGVIAVTCIAPSNTIQGTVVVTATGTGSAVNTPMLRAGSN